MAGATFEERKQQYIDLWLQDAPSVETDAELGRAVLGLILGLVRMQHGIADDDPRRAAVDAETIRRLAHPNDLGPMFSIAEAVFWRLATDPEGAMRYLSDHVSARSTLQSKRAKKPRHRDVFSQRIDELVADDPDIPTKKVEALLLEIGGITLIDGELRHTETAETMRLNNLPDRVSEAKKRRKKDSGQPG